MGSKKRARCSVRHIKAPLRAGANERKYMRKAAGFVGLVWVEASRRAGAPPAWALAGRHGQANAAHCQPMRAVSANTERVRAASPHAAPQHAAWQQRDKGRRARTEPVPSANAVLMPAHQAPTERLSHAKQGLRRTTAGKAAGHDQTARDDEARSQTCAMRLGARGGAVRPANARLGGAAAAPGARHRQVTMHGGQQHTPLRHSFDEPEAPELRRFNDAANTVKARRHVYRPT